MGIEDNIRDLLSQGYSPQDIIREGYSKSTVYKVYGEFTTEVVPVSAPAWQITGQFAKRRHLPGETTVFRYSVRNTSGIDLYVYRSGLQPEWLGGEWYARENRFLLRPGDSRNLAITIPIPADIPLGEYEMRCGLDAQFVGPGAPISGSSIQTQWAEPFILEVKKPTTSYRVFISHSTADMHLVRQLQHSLDNEGIDGIVAEDMREPGRVLEEKFKTKIRESHFFLALLTSNGFRSSWVLLETNYALSINKPSILLKEKEVQAESGIEWVEFSRYDSLETIITEAQKALELVKQRHYGSALPPDLVPVAIGVLAFLFGLLVGKHGK